MATWKYTLPAFLVPFAFVLTPAARGCCSRARSGGPWRRRSRRSRSPRWPRPPAGGCSARPGRPSGCCPGWPRCSCCSWRRCLALGGGLLIVAVALHLAMRRSGGALTGGPPGWRR